MTAMQMQFAIIRVQDSTAAAARQAILAMGRRVLIQTAVLTIHVLQASTALILLLQAKGSHAASVQKEWLILLLPLISEA